MAQTQCYFKTVILSIYNKHVLSGESSKLTDKALQATLQQFLSKAMDTITWLCSNTTVVFQEVPWY